ncbi:MULTISPECIES: hypothetical protein [Rhizobium]|uniref:DUF1127 domain-containing protein n=1 Tax=Rhizobium wuzhouense TaxID=1986026 RepID=A0ABX5NUI8_9HYPH|nr:MULTISPECIES: hypothetical protein [Rhizobium]PYB75110.1 hypothetical protein DMY87_06470 [Rhizobium wuzhouense]RKE84682.1 hypothetical protein DFO46_1453 [Rhizobium sp. AG855]
MKTMTMVCCDTPITRTAPAATLGAMARRAAGRLATKLNGLARTIAEHHRARRDRAALEALPFDLRKDLGWPAGDTAR